VTRWCQPSGAATIKTGIISLAYLRRHSLNSRVNRYGTQRKSKDWKWRSTCTQSIAPIQMEFHLMIAGSRLLYFGPKAFPAEVRPESFLDLVPLRQSNIEACEINKSLDENCALSCSGISPAPNPSLKRTLTIIRCSYSIKIGNLMSDMVLGNRYSFLRET
jgi:hypothetical protein